MAALGHLHFPLMSSAEVSRESVLTPVAVSTTAFVLQGDSSAPEPVSGQRGFKHSLESQMHLAQTLLKPHLWGQVLHSSLQLADLPDESGQRNAEHMAGIQSWDIAREALRGLDNLVSSWT